MAFLIHPIVTYNWRILIPRNTTRLSKTEGFHVPTLAGTIDSASRFRNPAFMSVAGRDQVNFMSWLMLGQQ